MSSKTLAKSIVVLDCTARDPDFVCFQPSETVYKADDPLHFDLPTEDWEAMGSPDKITVTIEPGDRLTP